MAKKPRVAQFVVTFPLPDDLTVAAAQKYVDDAVSSWRGQYFAGDADDGPEPEWEIDGSRVRVRRLRWPKK